MDLDKIEALDVGVYSHFDQLLSSGLAELLKPAVYLSGYVAVGSLFFLSVLILLLQGRRRSALFAALAPAVAFAVLFGIRFLVPRRRPNNAGKWIEVTDLTGSYPAAGLFLFMVAVIVLGAALWRISGIWLRFAYVMVAWTLTAYVCMAELMLSLHFLTDIIGALVAAAALGWIVVQCISEPLIDARLD